MHRTLKRLSGNAKDIIIILLISLYPPPFKGQSQQVSIFKVKELASTHTHEK